MNFSKNSKWQMVLAALGFSLVISARANSQEIVNTEFATPSTSVGSNFNSALPAPETNAAVAPQSVYTPVTAMRAPGILPLSAPRHSPAASLSPFLAEHHSTSFRETDSIPLSRNEVRPKPPVPSQQLIPTIIPPKRKNPIPCRVFFPWQSRRFFGQRQDPRWRCRWI